MEGYIVVENCRVYRTDKYIVLHLDVGNNIKASDINFYRRFNIVVRLN